MAFLATENKNRHLEDLPQADFGRVPERFLSVRPKSITKNLQYWQLRPLFTDFVVIQRLFYSWVRQGTFQFLFGGCRSSYFHSLIKSTLLARKRLLCLCDGQNYTWLLVDMKFLFSCSTRHLSRSLRSIVGYRVKNSKRNSLFHIYAHTCIIANYRDSENESENQNDVTVCCTTM